MINTSVINLTLILKKGVDELARPIKDGVDYFPKDTDFYSDDKVRLLRAEFGAKGMYMIDYLLCEIYRKNGYFLKWDKKQLFLVSDGAGCGCTPEYISEFISGCIRCSFFDQRVFNMFGVITSAGIQRRYMRMLNSRTSITIIKEYFLLDINDKNDVPTSILNKVMFKSIKSTENPDKSTENPDKSTENQENKKKRKVSKDTQNKSNNILIDVPEEIRAQWDAYVAMRKQQKKPLTQRAADLAMAKLQKLAPNDYKLQGLILDQSVFNCWQGLFALKNEGGSNFGRPNSEFKPSRT